MFSLSFGEHFDQLRVVARHVLMERCISEIMPSHVNHYLIFLFPKLLARELGRGEGGNKFSPIIIFLSKLFG
jgi:hypothetical protein